MKFSTAIKIGFLTVLLAPMLSYAAMTFGSLTDLANTLANGVVTSLGYLMFTLAVVAFFWGIVQFIWAARQGDAGKGVENGKQFMLWGLIALFVMFSVWGIITFAQSVLGIQGQTTIVIPNIQLLGGTASPGTTSTSNAGQPCTVLSTSQPGRFDSSGNCVPNSASTTGQPCTVLATSQPGRFDASGNCVPNSSTTVDAVCQTQGSGTACTTRNATGATVSGYCNNSNQCVPGASPNGGGRVGFGGSCRISAECSGNLVCDVNNSCRYPKGHSCEDDSDCGTAACDLNTNTCQ